MTTSELCEDSIFGNSIGHCVYKIGWFYVGEEINDFRLCCAGFFSQGNLSLFSENFKLVSQRYSTLPLSDLSLEGRCWNTISGAGGVALEGEG